MYGLPRSRDTMQSYSAGLCAGSRRQHGAETPTTSGQGETGARKAARCQEELLACPQQQSSLQATSRHAEQLSPSSSQAVLRHRLFNTD